MQLRQHVPPRAARLRALGALCITALATTACYRYVPVDPAAVRPDQEVRVRITEPAATRLVSEFGGYTGQLEGLLAPARGDSLALAVAVGREYRGMALEHARQTLVLGRAEVVDVRRRELSRARTALAAAAVLTAFGVLVNSVVLQEDPNPDDDETPPPPPTGGYRGVLFRLKVRR